MTNADKIRQMSNDKLADLIDSNAIDIFSCDECMKPKVIGCCEGPCIEWIKKWLDEESVDE